jgi:predicted ABC-type sugar transport system permease subunit
MAVLRNGLSLAGESDLTRTQMLAAALIAAVLIDNLRRRLTA